MQELERLSPEHRHVLSGRVAIVGAGRLGTALAAALRGAGVAVDGPLARDARGPASSPEAVLLCVPDAAIAAAAAGVPPGPAVGHCSGALGLDVLGRREGFSLHPLMTVTTGADPGVFAGAAAALDASSPATLALAQALARTLGMTPVRIAGEDRPAYHAAASIASNFLVALEAAAEELGATAGLERAQLVPLVRATVENWAALGPARALTGPVARGDVGTVERQRDALRERTPELLELFDALAAATRRLAEREALAC